MNTELQRLSDIAATNSKGVNNFNEFRLDMTQKVAFVHGAAKAWSIILGTVLTIAAVTCGWAFREIYPALRQIMSDYYSHHPNARLQHSQADARPELASETSDAAIGPVHY